MDNTSFRHGHKFRTPSEVIAAAKAKTEPTAEYRNKIQEFVNTTEAVVDKIVRVRKGLEEYDRFFETVVSDAGYGAEMSEIVGYEHLGTIETIRKNIADEVRNLKIYARSFSLTAEKYREALANRGEIPDELLNKSCDKHRDVTEQFYSNVGSAQLLLGDIGELLRDLLDRIKGDGDDCCEM